MLPSLKVLCGYCKQEDPGEGDGAETVEWIQCDACDKWYHQVCAVTHLMMTCSGIAHFVLL